MKNTNFRLQISLTSALGFGLSFVIGNILSKALFRSGALLPVRDLFLAEKWIIGLALFIVVAGLGGALTGAVGGATLSLTKKSAHWRNYAWRSALSFGLSYALVLVPFVLTLSMYSFYDTSDSAPFGLALLVGIIGAVFGLVYGLIFGLLTVGKKFWRVGLVGAAGFGAGGFALGYGVWLYFFSLADTIWAAVTLFIAIFLFGGIGGAAIAYAYSFWDTPFVLNTEGKPSWLLRLWTKFQDTRFVRKVGMWGAIVLILLGLAFVGIVRTTLIPHRAKTSNVLVSQTRGTHWLNPQTIAANAVLQADLFAPQSGGAALVWAQATDDGAEIFYAAGPLSAPLHVSRGHLSGSPQLVVDSAETAHIVWAENADSEAIFYSQCAENTCSPPLNLSELAAKTCQTSDIGGAANPAIAIDAADTVMVVWQTDGKTPYVTWPAADRPSDAITGCVSGDNEAMQNPRLDGGKDGQFALAFESDGSVYTLEYRNGQWNANAQEIGQGSAPEIYLNQKNHLFAAWCSADNRLTVWTPDWPAEQIDSPGCVNRPAITQDEQNRLRLIWYADEVANRDGLILPNHLVYESVRQNSAWSEATIIAQTQQIAQPALAAGAEGKLHLAWVNKALYYTTHQDYTCNGVELSTAGQKVYDIVQQGKYHPASNPIPFCQNRYEGLLYAPNPNPVFSSQPPTPDGPFDHFAELAKTARYEVLFATMWYQEDIDMDSPGSLLAQSIAKLYHQLKENPARYPRGITVRILVGNPPEFVVSQFKSQFWNVMEDLKAAGVPEMRNPDIGWRVEVANYEGSWPHSHTKLIVVDGKTAQVVGFNMSYDHMPVWSASGRGGGRVDLGSHVTGPAAQAVVTVFDDLWNGANSVYCSNFRQDASALWMLSCRVEEGVATHVPEVLKYYLPGDDDKVFSLYRSAHYKESDEAFAQALASAQKTIDTTQVNFTLNLVCDLNVLFEVCTFEDSPVYMSAMMKAIEENGVKVRVLIEGSPIEGVENGVAIKAFEDALRQKGLEDHLEIRYFDGATHSKAALIDDELLIVGSQNFHYSAWGKSGLTEYNLAWDDPEAVGDFKRMYEYYWDRAVPAE